MIGPRAYNPRDLRRCQFLTDDDVIREDDEFVSITGIPFPTGGTVRIVGREDVKHRITGKVLSIVGARVGDVGSFYVSGTEPPAPVWIRRWEDFDEDDSETKTDLKTKEPATC